MCSDVMEFCLDAGLDYLEGVQVVICHTLEIKYTSDVETECIQQQAVRAVALGEVRSFM